MITDEALKKADKEITRLKKHNTQYL